MNDILSDLNISETEFYLRRFVPGRGIEPLFLRAGTEVLRIGAPYAVIEHHDTQRCSVCPASSKESCDAAYQNVTI